MQRVSPFIDSETGKPVSLKRTKSAFKPPRKMAKIEEEEIEQTQPLDFDVPMECGSDSDSESIEFDDGVLREEIQSWLVLNGPSFFSVEAQKHLAKIEKAKKKSSK